MPPPASATEKTWPQWSRPPPPLIFGVRPNSPHQHDQRLVEQAALPQVFQQRRIGQVHRRHQARSSSRVGVLACVSQAGLSAGVARHARPVDLHQRHARLDQPPRQQHALAELIAAIAIAHRRRFLIQVERPPRACRAQQVERLLRAIVEARDGTAAVDGVEVAVDLLQQREPIARTRSGGTSAGSVRPGSGSRRVRIAVDAATDRRSGRGSRRPGRARGCSVVPDVSGSTIDAGRPAVGRRRRCTTRAPGRASRSARRAWRSPSSSAGAARRSASSSRSTSGRCRRWTRPQHADLVDEPRGPRHQLADVHAGHAGGDRLKLAANFERRVGLGIPRLVLRRPAEEEEERCTTSPCRTNLSAEPASQPVLAAAPAATDRTGRVRRRAATRGVSGRRTAENRGRECGTYRGLMTVTPV